MSLFQSTYNFLKQITLIMKKNIVKNPMTSSYISKSNVKVDVKQSKPKHYSQIKDDFGGNF